MLVMMMHLQQHSNHRSWKSVVAFQEGGVVLMGLEPALDDQLAMTYVLSGTLSLYSVAVGGAPSGPSLTRFYCFLDHNFWTSTLALPWIFVLGQRFDHYECGRLSWLGQLYGGL